MKAIKVREDLKHLLKALDLLKYPAVSIGVAQGLFDRDMLNWGLSKLYSIDSWTEIKGQKGDGGFGQDWHDANFEHAKQLLSQFGDKSVMVKSLSVPASRQFQDNSLGFVYLDGDHSYEGAKNDLHAWFPKLIKGGVLAGHDYLNLAYGVNKAVNEFAALNNLEVITIPDIAMENAGFWFQKK